MARASTLRIGDRVKRRVGGSVQGDIVSIKPPTFHINSLHADKCVRVAWEIDGNRFETWEKPIELRLKEEA